MSFTPVSGSYYVLVGTSGDKGQAQATLSGGSYETIYSAYNNSSAASTIYVIKATSTSSITFTNKGKSSTSRLNTIITRLY